MNKLSALLVSLSLLNTACFADVETLYQKKCASCHGNNLEGGMASSLIDDQWQYGSSPDAIKRSISEGINEKGMPAWKQNLSPEQIRALVIFIQEKGADSQPQKEVSKDQTFKSQSHAFRLKKVAEGDGILWSVELLPDGRLISAQRDGTLWLFDQGKGQKIKQTPKVWHGGQAGLLEAVAHPDYLKNGWIYLAFSHSDDGRKGMTRLVRGKIDKQGKWVQQENIFQAQSSYEINTQYHFGTRIVFKEGYLFFAIGDRGRQDMAQDTSKPNGKIHRLFDDGRIPKDNPFASQGYGSIFSYGPALALDFN